MRANQILLSLVRPTIFCLLLASAGVVFSQSLSFTYQGRLNDGGAPANGNYDLEFRMFADESGGTALATEQRLNVVVSAGVFTVTLVGDTFTGARRFLEIAVKPVGGSTFITLNPRQPITSTPYAIRSLSAGNADTATNATQLGGVAAGQYVLTSDSRLADARPPTAGSSNYIQNTTTQQAPSNFNISGNGIVGGTLGIGTTPSCNGIFGFCHKVDIAGDLRVRGQVYWDTISGDSSRPACLKNLPGSGNFVGGCLGISLDSASTGIPGISAHSTTSYGIFARSENTHAIYAEGSVRFNRWIQVDELRGGGGTSVCWNSAHELSSCSSSSIRYKKNVGGFDYGLGVVRRLRPITFDWRLNGSRDVGLVAEEVEKAAPLLAVYDKDGRVEGVKYDKLGVVLINAVKEQQEQINQQQDQLKQQQSLIEHQAGLINNLRRLVCRRNVRAAVCRR